MKQFDVLVGLGSGKSTYLKHIRALTDVFVYSTDDYIEEKAAALGKTYSECWAELIKGAETVMNAGLVHALAAEKRIAWDQTNMSEKKRRSIINRVPRSYHLTCYCIAPPRNDEEWAELNLRLANRPGKVIPDTAIDNMIRSYVEPSLSEGFDYVFICDIYGNPIKVLQ